MKYKISNIKVPIEQYSGEVQGHVAKIVKLNINQIKSFKVLSQAVDARKRNVHEIYFVFTVFVDYEGKIRKNKHFDVCEVIEVEKAYTVKKKLTNKIKKSPIIIGSGPSGLFAAVKLAEYGLNPIVLERGKDVDERKKDVDNFWKSGLLNVKSNVQFGEGGAGTFSDGKLTTRVKDPLSKEVLRYFVQNGAPEEILIIKKPHLGTDNLCKIIKNLRAYIEKLGGQILFEKNVTDFILEDNKIKGVVANGNETFLGEHVILACGHSARDTYKMIIDNGVFTEAKGFAIGLRIEHSQNMIDEIQYGKHKDNPYLQAAEYGLAYKDSTTGRGVYSFCMCPGGLVISAASECDSLVVNGMSYHSRDLNNANSAIVASVLPSDFMEDPFQGIEFQRKFEKLAFQLGGGGYKAPVQMVEDFINGKVSQSLGTVNPSYRPGFTFADLRECLPEQVGVAIKNGLVNFDTKIQGFSYGDGVLTGVETRTSSPVRITRNRQDYQSINTGGLYPIGEGAGYAGGIMSAAIDGLNCANAVVRNISMD